MGMSSTLQLSGGGGGLFAGVRCDVRRRWVPTEYFSRCLRERVMTPRRQPV